MRNFIDPGDTLTLVAPYAVITGAGLLVGSLFAVAAEPAGNGATVEAMTEGVFDLAKASGAWTQGAKVYWDNSAKNVTTTASGNTLIGVATQAQLSGDTTGRVDVTGQIAAVGTGVTTQSAPATLSIAAVTGVDGAGNNAASKANVDTAFAAVVTAYNLLLTKLTTAGVLS